MSGHKWLGAPVPCGVFMTRRKYQLAPPDDPEYIGASDTTFAGSRSPLGAAILWCYFARTSYEEQIRKAILTEELAAYAFAKLTALGRRVPPPRFPRQRQNRKLPPSECRKQELWLFHMWTSNNRGLLPLDAGQVQPAAHGLIGHQDPTLSQQILDVAEAQDEPDIKPDRLLAISGGKR